MIGSQNKPKALWLAQPLRRALPGTLELLAPAAQVYVSAAKRAVLATLGLGPEYTELLTTDDCAARLHAVPLWRVSLKHMGRVLKHFRGRFNTVVGFQPTGWCMQTGEGRPGGDHKWISIFLCGPARTCGRLALALATAELQQ